MISRQSMEEWNNGTIYRIFVQRSINPTSHVIDVPVDIAQSELTGKVLIGVENFCLDRQLVNTSNTNMSDLSQQDETLIENWCQEQYLVLASVNLPPDIDFTTNEITGQGSNTQVFARLPLEIHHQQKSGGDFVIDPRTSHHFPLNKDGILYEMTNNPNAISNGRMRIYLQKANNSSWDMTNTPIYNLSFTIVIYKPRNTYN